jgi:hypothetical protein
MLLALAPLLATGCLSPLNKHAVALSEATAPVVDGAAAAYRSANSIHNTRQDYQAFVDFDAPAPAPVYNPRSFRPLLSDHDIEVRLTVLAAFQEYVKSVVAVTNGTDSPELQAASESAGANLTTLGNDIAPSIQSALNIAQSPDTLTTTTVTTTTGATSSATASTSSSATPAISETGQNVITTAADALGQFLISRKVKKELPHIVVNMDPNVKTLCDLLQSDISILNDLETHDYNYIINQQTQFLLANVTLDGVQRRKLIMQLPEIVRREQASSAALKQLSAAVVNLEMTHHALAAAAQGNNPESFKQKLVELQSAGKELGQFYSSLSTDTD